MGAHLLDRLTSIAAIPYLVMLLLLSVVAIINVRLRIIPNAATYPGTVLAVVLHAALSTWIGRPVSDALAFSIMGALVGYLHARLVMELAKMAFGKVQYQLDREPMHWHREGFDATLLVGGEEWLWSDFFARGNESIEMECNSISIEKQHYADVTARWTLDFLQVGDLRWQLVKTDDVTGAVSSMTLPREPIGFGLVKLSMAIGAFTGAMGALFIFWVGAVLVMAGAAIRHFVFKNTPPTMEASPYLLLSAAIWTIIWLGHAA